MKKIISISAICIFLILMVSTTKVEANWQASKPFVTDIYCTEWLNSQVGYVGVKGSVYKTTNGGAVWTLVLYDADTYFQFIKFSNDQVGFATFVSGVYKTTNAGQNWTYYLSPALDAFQIFYAVNDQVLFAGVRDNGNGLYKSTNGGVNWTSCAPRLGAQVAGYYYNGSKLFAACVDSFYSSTNLGVSWTAKPFFKSKTYSFAVNNGVFFMGQHFTNGVKVLRSTNEGIDWTSMVDSTSQKPNGLVSISFANTLTGYAVGYRNDSFSTYSGVALKTTNNGFTWVQVYTRAERFNHVSCTNEKAFISANDGYLISAEHTVGITQTSSEIPSQYTLKQNFPNPFNPTTNINFSIPKNGNVTLTVYDVRGREVAVLINQTKSAGSYTVDFKATNLTSGIYFYILQSGDFTDTKKMMLVK